MAKNLNVKSIIGIIVGIVVIIFGIKLRSKPDESKRKVDLTVTDAVERRVYTSDGLKLSYDVSGTVKECPGKTLELIDYRPPGMVTTLGAINIGKKVIRGDVIPVWIKQDCNYRYASKGFASNKTKSNIVIIIGVLYLLFIVYAISKGLV